MNRYFKSRGKTDYESDLVGLEGDDVIADNVKFTHHDRVVRVIISCIRMNYLKLFTLKFWDLVPKFQCEELEIIHSLLIV